MTPEQQLKVAELKAVAERALYDLPHGAKDMLYRELAHVPSVRAYAMGTSGAPDAAELVAELWATRTGQALRSLLAEQQAADAAEASTIDLSSMTPQQRMNWARRHQ